MPVSHEPVERQYHFVLTLQGRDGQCATAEGTHTVGLGCPDSTRHDAFLYLRERLVREMGQSGSVIVWSFEPNEL
ncbi:hypothetical protein [Streptomyces longispororuber]|uniref:hypothetical protein n=1 Tax=Streptomyces longispororuber TaxID=68230 RepID=UPI00210D4A05|nr:hypothetical protein [Streptomyces longispororuber]MCQ4212376.1 hypothetical protein [Streptomyces longispororuber]